MREIQKRKFYAPRFVAHNNVSVTRHLVDYVDFDSVTTALTGKVGENTEAAIHGGRRPVV